MKSHIVVIEDNPANLELMTYLLNHSGFEISTAINGEEGIELIQKNNPDLIICDIQLPKMDGYEIAKQLKSSSQYKDIPLIAVTAYSMAGDQMKILAAGFDDYISKPIDPETFIARIKSHLQ